jgi:hypothetical protein
MDDDYHKCVKETLAHVNKCEKHYSLVKDELGSVDLPSPAETGCGSGFNLGMLQSVDMHARSEEYLDTTQCAKLAAQMICGINGFPKDLQPKDTFDPAQVPNRQDCVCSVIRACTAQILPRLAQYHKNTAAR